MKIVPFSETHLEKTAALEKECFSAPWTKEMFRQELKNSLAVYFAALEGEEVVGYAGMWMVLDEGHITNIAVSPRHRRRGIGTLLLNSLIDHAKAAGICVLMLEVRKSNTAAIRLYGASGFTPAGLRKGYYSDNGEDALLMNLVLA